MFRVSGVSFCEDVDKDCATVWPSSLYTKWLLATIACIGAKTHNVSKHLIDSCCFKLK